MRPRSDAVWTRAAAAAAALLWAGAVLLFFRQEVLSTLSDVSGGDVTWSRQLFHNAVHGRLFETSVYHNNLGGVVDSPWPYANNTANHVNFTPYLFAAFYALWPTLSGYYAVCLLAQYGGLALFLGLAARRSSRDRAWLVLAVLLLSSGLFWTATANGLLPLYLAPCFAAMVYGLEAGKPLVYGVAAALGCLVSEDSAVFLACFGAVVAIFNERRRAWGAATFCGAVAWTLLAFLWLQPAARVGMELTTGTNLADRLARTTEADGIRRWLGNLLELLRAVAVFAPALVFAAMAAGRSLRASLREALPLVFLAPAFHWVVSVMAGGGHHWLPVILCLLYAFYRLLCGPGAAPLPQTPRGLGRPAAAALAVYACLNAFGLYYLPIKHAAKAVVLPRLVGYAAPDHSRKVAHNRRVLAFVDSIPPERSVTFLLDDPITAYAAGRSDFWWFPEYLDRTDLLVIDKDAGSFHWRNVNFHLDPSWNAFLDGLAGPDGAIPPGRLGELRDRLAKSHRVVRDDADLLVLERVKHEAFPLSPTSRGLSFLRSGPRAAAAARPSAN
ncbi:MAG TPA: DUF2079 domain-containing protein [Elusimicrobiota bacterium]|nr:DUF2079 domain-containing protein [Elusimicrobiota bacterium]